MKKKDKIWYNKTDVDKSKFIFYFNFMKIKSIKSVQNLNNKRILLRADFNVPVKKGKILDEFKVMQGLETICYLLKNQSKVIILTHLGKPKAGIKEKKYSVKKIADALSRKLDKKVEYVDDISGFKAGTAVTKMKPGDIIMLENIRFAKGEESNSKILAKNLAKLADIYVNDAFAVSHRNHASVSAIKRYLPAYAGLLLEKELINLSMALHPKGSLVVVLGGAKIGTKLPLIKKFYKQADKILIGGGIANNFYKAQGKEIGQSIFDNDSLKFAKNYQAKNLIIPVDVVAEDIISKKITVRSADRVSKREAIYDIGPKTIHIFASIIKKADTIFWNGPLGMFENQKYKHGTLAIARVIASRSTGKAFGVVGGGETIEALSMTKMIKYVDWVSTGGGAMLSYLGGEKMPGLYGLVNK